MPGHTRQHLACNEKGAGWAGARASAQRLGSVPIHSNIPRGGRQGWDHGATEPEVGIYMHEAEAGVPGVGANTQLREGK